MCCVRRTGSAAAEAAAARSVIEAERLFISTCTSRVHRWGRTEGSRTCWDTETRGADWDVCARVIMRNVIRLGPVLVLVWFCFWNQHQHLIRWLKLNFLKDTFDSNYFPLHAPRTAHRGWFGCLTKGQHMQYNVFAHDHQQPVIVDWHHF